MNRRQFLKNVAVTAAVLAVPGVVLSKPEPVIIISQELVTDEPIVVTEGSVILRSRITYTGHDCAIRVPAGVKDYVIMDNIISSCERGIGILYA